MLYASEEASSVWLGRTPITRSWTISPSALLIMVGLCALVLLAGFGIGNVIKSSVAEEAVTSDVATRRAGACKCLGHVPWAGIQWSACPDELWGRNGFQGARSTWQLTLVGSYTYSGIAGIRTHTPRIKNGSDMSDVDSVALDAALADPDRRRRLPRSMQSAWSINCEPPPNYSWQGRLRTTGRNAGTGADPSARAVPCSAESVRHRDARD